jgi:hypothetical protein
MYVPPVGPLGFPKEERKRKERKKDQEKEEETGRQGGYT